jgi:hypothetical protein
MGKVTLTYASLNSFRLFERTSFAAFVHGGGLGLSGRIIVRTVAHRTVGGQSDSLGTVQQRKCKQQAHCIEERMA